MGGRGGGVKKLNGSLTGKDLSSVFMDMKQDSNILTFNNNIKQNLVVLVVNVQSPRKQTA